MVAGSLGNYTWQEPYRGAPGVFFPARGFRIISSEFRLLIHDFFSFLAWPWFRPCLSSKVDAVTALVEERLFPMTSSPSAGRMPIAASRNPLRFNHLGEEKKTGLASSRETVPLRNTSVLFMDLNRESQERKYRRQGTPTETAQLGALPQPLPGCWNSCTCDWKMLSATAAAAASSRHRHFTPPPPLQAAALPDFSCLPPSYPSRFR